MSIHPVGPWAETNSESWQVYSKIVETLPPAYGGGTQVFNLFPFTGSRTVSRTGVNNGSKLYKLPSSASLNQLETSVSGKWYCEGQRYLGSPTFQSTQFIADGGGPPGIAFSYSLVDPNALASAENAAYNKLRRRINGAIAEGGVFTGEIKDTLRTIKHGASLISQSTTDATALCRKIVKDVTSRRFTATAKDLADLILEFDFGVKPLINDVKSGIEAYYRRNENIPIRRKVHGSFALDFSSGDRFLDYYQPHVQFMSFDAEIAKRQSVFVKMGCSVDLRTDPGKLDDSLLAWGVSPIQLLSIGYEIFPYSWLLDHYTNMNDFIDWFSLRRGVSTDRWKVKIIKTLQTEKMIPKSSNNCTLSHSHASKVLRYNCIFNRDPFVVDAYLPQLVIKTPQIAQAVDEIALATSRIAGFSHGLEKLMGPKLSIRQRGTLTNLINERIIR